MWLLRAEAGLNPSAKPPLFLQKYLIVLNDSGRVALIAYLAPEHND